MGWSCSRAAMETMQKISDACRKQTQSQNSFVVQGKSYFFEQSRRETPEGAITGTIQKEMPSGLWRMSGSFKIDADGTFIRGPKFMKDAAK